MAEIVWIETPLITDASSQVSPGTTQDILNSLNAAAYRLLWLTADIVGGTNASLTVTLWLWNGTRYVKTGDVFYLRPGADNLSRHDGGGWFAYEVVAVGSPTSWSFNIGGQR